jgi:8-oxo-dGTP pyrophosphatase MutT (NUDIX family)
MELSILREPDSLPSFIAEKLASVSIDYKNKYRQIKSSGNTNTPELAAGVVLLLNYKKISHSKYEYVFQLIKRSDKISQGGDISCPGGMLHPITDKFLSKILANRIIRTMPDYSVNFLPINDKETANLVRLFLINAVREAWEEIGLNPFSVIFLGALPCYSLTLFARTIFPLVCLTPKPFKFKLSAEVEKILEIPISIFFEGSNYALLEIETPFSNSTPVHSNQFPCIILTDDQGKQEILWGATFNIIMNFLRIISDNGLPALSSFPTIKKALSKTYISGNSQ